ncbi:MobF family relaxase [Salsipaludibacter albus]|uniref:MobF family relaxase n=1 Tax=Salsipaludibacter albus TaxID=2849650 RepID=UPI001EE47E9E|nr:MobF family relaxase [Salsipaludibacter albus]MBY5161483.1 relaxase domain-containing protein [Salsipaludibacter albus]
MLNIGRMAPGGEDYYLATVADGVEEYYFGHGELPGRWLGGGADTLGLSGRVTPEQLRTVLGGRDPADDAPLLAQRQRTVPGFDLTFRAPKSVSLLYGLGDDDVADQVRQAHDDAIEAAVGYLEREAVWTRRGRGGAERVPTTGAVAAAFMHRTSRAGDPLLHTHVLVANLAQAADDGQWRTVDSRRLYAHAKTAGYLYQAHLRDHLTRTLGVAWTPVTNGTADLTGVPREVIEAFSQRRAEILDLMERRGETSARAAQIATLETRESKADLPDQATLRDRWADQATQLGFDPAELSAIVHSRVLEPVAGDRLAGVADELLGPDGLTARASTFTRRDVLRAWCQQLPDGSPIGRVERLADVLLDDEAGGVVALDQPDGTVQLLSSRDVIRRPDGTAVAALPDDTRYSTPDLLALEQRLVHQSTTRISAGVAIVDDATVDRVLADRPSIAGEQAAMVRRLTGSGAGIEVVIGKAGAGKTYALDAARAAWHASGRRVIGTALAARAALELETGAGIDSYTIDRLLADVEHPHHGGLAPNSVLVVDEAGMVGTRKLARLLDAAATANAKVVLVGDPYQLPEIDAGGLLRGLANRLHVIELSDNRRQSAGWERDALDHLRNGDPTTGLSAYHAAGRIHIGETVDAAREQLVSDWWHARTEHDLDGVMVALRRTDVDDLNTRARTRMAADGELTGPELDVGGSTFQAGDRIVCLRNDRRLDVVNGTRGKVESVDEAARTLTIRIDVGNRPVDLPASYLDAGHVDHAYAITGHKAQGLTTDATWILGSDAMYREWGYVALSRGRHQNHLYIVADPIPDPAGHDTVLGATGDAARRLAARLRRSQGQHLALDHTGQDFTGRDDHDLQAVHDQLRTRLLQAARTEPTPNHDQVEARHHELTARVDELAQQLDALEAKPPSRWRRRPNPDETARVQAALEMTERHLAEVASGLAHPESSHELSDLLEAFEDVDQELGRRAHLRSVAAGHELSDHLTSTFGPRPDTPAERNGWTALVTAIEHYRTTWGIDDPRTPLGPRPSDLTQRRAHDAIASQLPDAHRQPDRDVHDPTPVRDLPARRRA